MTPKQVRYRGRLFNVVSETKDQYIIESWGTQRSVFKDEIIYEEPVEPKDVVSFGPTKDYELLTPANDVLPETKPEGKDLVQEAPKLEPGSYEAEILGTYPNGGTTTYKVEFDVYGENLEELSIQKITDIDTGGTEDLTSTLSPEELQDVELKINEKIKTGEVVGVSTNTTPDSVDEKVIRTVQNPDGTPVMKANGPQMEIIPGKDEFNSPTNTRIKQDASGNPVLGVDGQPEMEKFEEIKATPETKKFPQIGIDTSIFSSDERHAENKNTVEDSIIANFKEAILSMFENPEIEVQTEVGPVSEMTTELDSGKEYHVKYTIGVDETIDVQYLQDATTNTVVEFRSLPYHEQQQVLGAISAQEDIELDLDDLQEGEPCWDGYEMIGMKKSEAGKEVPNCVPIKEEIPLNEADKKKWKTKVGTKKDGSPRYVKHGHKDYKIAPGTSRGDSYCARSAGIKKDGKKMDCSGKDKNTPNCLSRRKWKCRGKKSTK